MGTSRTVADVVATGRGTADTPLGCAWSPGYSETRAGFNTRRFKPCLGQWYYPYLCQRFLLTSFLCKQNTAYSSCRLQHAKLLPGP